MSRIREVQTICKTCGRPLSIIVYDSVNSDFPDVYEEITSGSLFKTKCGNCGKITTAVYPILFNDMKHDTWIMFCFPNDLIATIEEMEKSLALINTMRKTRLRIVTDQASLQEKVFIFNNSMDDRVIELIKAFAISELEGQINGADIENVFFYLDEGVPYLEFVCGDKIETARVDSQEYSMIADCFDKDLKTHGDRDPVVDIDWAFSFLEEQERKR